MRRDMKAFDDDHTEALPGLWFVGDVHGEFSYLAKALLAAEQPDWIVFAGDIDIMHRPFHEILEPVHRSFPGARVAFIYGNHDADSFDHWNYLHACGDAMPLHGKVIEMNGIRVAGLGGNFMDRVWAPPSKATFRNRDAAMAQSGIPQLMAAIYPNDVEHLARRHADILVTHEAPDCHPYGWEAISQLSRDLGIVRSFHGHHHDDLSDQYALVHDQLGFDARAVNYCAIKNGLGDIIIDGPKGW